MLGREGMLNSTGRGCWIGSLSMNNHSFPALNASFSCFSKNKPRILLKRGSCSHLFVASKHWTQRNCKLYSLAGVKRSVGLSAVSPNEMDQILSVTLMLVLNRENDKTDLYVSAYDTACSKSESMQELLMEFCRDPPY